MTRIRHSLTNDVVARKWTDAYAYKARIEAREAGREKPQPVLTQCALLFWSSFWFAAVLIFSNGPEFL